MLLIIFKSKKLLRNIIKSYCDNAIFQRTENAMVCGLDEVIALLHTFAYKPRRFVVEALHDEYR